MKKLSSCYGLLTLIALILTFPGCVKDEVTRTYSIMRPIFADKAQVIADIKSGTPRQLESPGKIFIKGHHLFINELNKGVHVFDNSNPSSPKAVSFISIPGNIDIAVSGSYLYADMYTDMLTIDIHDPLNARLVDTAAFVFPERMYYSGWSDDPSQIIVDWVVKDTTVSAEPVNGWFGDCAACIFVPQSASSDNFKAYVPGIAGSMARFVIVNNYLYGVNQHSLVAFNIDNPADPVRTADVGIGWQIETIYPFMNHLFIGSVTGMFIYNINNPAAPEPEGTFTHARSCDPVVADEDYAYVTLRANERCTGTANQLEIIDVADIKAPRLLATYPMSNPHGLAKDGDLLFICDGEAGVKIYDASDIHDLTMIKVLSNINAFDAIAWSGRLIISAKNGLFQYDYSEPEDIRLLSKIQVQ